MSSFNLAPLAVIASRSVQGSPSLLSALKISPFMLRFLPPITDRRLPASTT
jgi:hypothetical protein